MCMRPLSLSLAFLLPVVAACSGGGGVTSTPAAAVPQFQPQQGQSVVRAPSTSAPDYLLYVANSGTNSISVFRHEASGNTPPLYTIAGPKTLIDGPGQLSEDMSENLYVTNAGSILVFQHGARGNVAPIRVLKGQDNLLYFLDSVTVDPQTHTIFAATTSPQESPASLFSFPTSANGYAAPSAGGGPFFGHGSVLAMSSAGDVIDAHGEQEFVTNGIGIDTLQRQLDPILPSVYTIHNFAAFGIADDPSTKTFLASSASGIYRFHENTIKAVNDPTFKPAAVSIINDKCAGQIAVAPGNLPYTYALHPGNRAGCSTTPAVDVYYNSANGDVKPWRVLSGQATRLNAPTGIYEGN